MHYFDELQAKKEMGDAATCKHKKSVTNLPNKAQLRPRTAKRKALKTVLTSTVGL
jgi:hypothetical protein